LNDPPVAEANGPYTVGEGSFVALSSAGSGDADGTIVSYEWDLDYDGSTFDVDAAGTSPTFSAALLDGPTSRTVALRVTDNFGATAIDPATVTVLNVAPTAAVTGDTVGVACQSRRSFVLSAIDPSAADMAAGFTFHVDFGDGATLFRSEERRVGKGCRFG